MGDQDRPVAINASRIPVAGVGGLGLVAMAVVVSVFLPAAGGVTIAGLVGGCVLAVVIIIARRRIDARNPHGPAPAVLFVESDEPSPSPSPAQQERSDSLFILPDRERSDPRLVPARQRV